MPEPAVADREGKVTDIAELISGHHRRILRLFASLDRTARYAAPRTGQNAGPDWTLPTMWDRIVALLDAHATAAEQVYYPTVFRGKTENATAAGAAADLGNLRAAVAQARQHPAGSPAWWRAVRTARQASTDHITRMDRALSAPARWDGGPASPGGATGSSPSADGEGKAQAAQEKHIAQRKRRTWPNVPAGTPKVGT